MTNVKENFRFRFNFRWKFNLNGTYLSFLLFKFLFKLRVPGLVFILLIQFNPQTWRNNNIIHIHIHGDIDAS